MPLYEFRCKPCKAQAIDFDNDPPLCEECALPMQRVYSFSFHRPMPDHFNATVGKYVSSDKQFREELKIQSAAETERTGILHNYIPVDPNDRASLGVTDEGLDATHRAEALAGRAEIKRWH